MGFELVEMLAARAFDRQAVSACGVAQLFVAQPATQLAINHGAESLQKLVESARPRGWRPWVMQALSAWLLCAGVQPPVHIAVLLRPSGRFFVARFRQPETYRQSIFSPPARCTARVQHQINLFKVN